MTGDGRLRADGSGTYHIGSHQIELTNSHNAHGSVSTFRCVSDGCWIESSGEFGARERIEELAERFDCPSGTSSCIQCGGDVLPVADICRECERALVSSVKIRPGDTDGG